MHDHHKEVRPDETINKIKLILNNIGLTEDKTTVMWNHAYDSFYSCGLIFNEYPAFRSNGKGMSKKLALASAYAEFIERLQCFGEYAFFDREKKSTKIANLLFPHKYLQTKKVFKDYPFLKDKISEESLKVLPKRLHTLPFINPIDNSTHYLPYFYLLSTGGSNGMCAGNSKEEALCQGICEVFERYIIVSLHEDRISSLPTIPLDKLNLKSGKLKKNIEEILDAGISITIKDCTLNGVFPVVCVICEDKKSNFIGVDFGSDPIFEIALQRCFTELFQGKKELSIKKDIRNFKYTENYSIGNTPTILYEKVLKSNKFNPNYINAFTDEGLSNKEYLSFLLSTIKKQKLQIFIRDFSFLGFPSFFVYIEKLSALYASEINSGLVYKYFLEENSDKIVYKIPNSTKKEKEKLLHYLTQVFSLPHSVFYYDLYSLRNFKYYSTSLNYRVIYIFLLLDAEKYLIAEKEIKKIVQFNNIKNPEELEFVKILADFIDLKIKSFEPEEILKWLSSKHQKSVYKLSLPHLINKDWNSFLQNEPIGTFYSKKFDFLPIPNCLGTYKCNLCGISKYCYLKKRQKIQSKLKDLYLTHLAEKDNKQREPIGK